MAGPLEKYSFINAKLRARISKLLSEETLLAMIRVGSLEESLGLLRNTPFASLEEIYSKTGDLKLGELALLKNEINVYTSIRRQVRGETQLFVDALLYRYEIENLKNALRLFFDRTIRRRSIDEAAHYILYDTVIHPLPIDAVIHAASFNEIVHILAPTPYSQFVAEHMAEVELDGTLFKLEIALDRFFYHTLITQTKALGSQDRREAMRLIGVEIDLNNINCMMRYKTFYAMTIEQVLATVIPDGINLSVPVIREAYAAQNVTPIIQQLIKSN